MIRYPEWQQSGLKGRLSKAYGVQGVAFTGHRICLIRQEVLPPMAVDQQVMGFWLPTVASGQA